MRIAYEPNGVTTPMFGRWLETIVDSVAGLPLAIQAMLRPVGRTLPRWPTLKNLRAAAHSAFRDPVVVGSDGAVLVNGACVIEGKVDADPDIVQRARRRPIDHERVGMLCADNVSGVLRRTATGAAHQLSADAAAPRPRVMLLIHDFRASGVVRNALAVATRLSGDFELTLVGRHDEGLLADEIRAGSWQTLTIGAPKNRVGVVASALRLRALCDRARPDLLLSFGNRTHWVAWLATLGRERPLRLYRLSNAVERPGRRAIHRRLGIRLLARDAKALAVVGSATVRSPAVRPLLATGKAAAIPAGVDIERARSLAREGPAPLDWPDDLPLVLSIGRLGPQKDFATLVRAVAQVNRTRPIRLMIIGKEEGRTRTELQDIAAEVGLADDRFLLPGETSNVFPWLAQASVFALSSRWEGSSLALLEAMALNVPVVAAREAGDAVEVLGEGRFGLLFDAGDVDGLAEAIHRQLLESPILPAERAGEYGVGAMAEAYARLVHETVGTRAAPPRESVGGSEAGVS